MPALVSLGRRPNPDRPRRFRLKTVDLDGPVAYADFGGEGSPLVLLHGIGGNHLNWIPSAAMLARHHRVMALDLSGFGSTPEAGRGSGMEAQRRLVERFLDDVVGEPAVLVGNSMGGLVALMVAAATPAKVSRLVLVSPAQTPTGDGLPTLPQALRLVVDTLPVVGEARLFWRGQRAGARGLFMDLLTFGTVDVRRVPAEAIEANVSAIARRMDRAPLGHATSFLAATRSMIATLAVPGRFDAWVRAVKAPTLIVHGRGDRLVPHAGSERLARMRPDWRLVTLDDSGHVPQLEHPERFVAELTGWLAGRPAAGHTSPHTAQEPLATAAA